MTAQEVCLSTKTPKYIASCAFFSLLCCSTIFSVCVEKRMKALSCSTTSQFMGRLLLIMSILKDPGRNPLECCLFSPSLLPQQPGFCYTPPPTSKNNSSFSLWCLPHYAHIAREMVDMIPKRPIVFHHLYTP